MYVYICIYIYTYIHTHKQTALWCVSRDSTGQCMIVAVCGVLMYTAFCLCPGFSCHECMNESLSSNHITRIGQADLSAPFFSLLRFLLPHTSSISLPLFIFIFLPLSLSLSLYRVSLPNPDCIGGFETFSRVLS